MAVRILERTFGRPATALLTELVRGAKGGDPLAPVTVVVPTAAAGASLRRRLATELGGLVAVELTSLRGVARRVAEPVLAREGRALVPPAVSRGHLRAVAAAADGLGGPGVRDSVATERALERTLAELADLDDAALARLGATGPTAAAVVALHREHRRRLAGGCIAADLPRLAADALAAGADVAALGEVVVHLPRRLTAGDERLLAALARRVPVTVVIGRTGHADADTAADVLEARLRRALGGAAPSPPSAGAGSGVEPAHGALTFPGAPTHLVRAPDPAEEAEVAAREVVAALRRGVPPERVAVVSRLREPYAAAVHRALAAAGVPHHAPPARTIAQSVPGRVALAALDVAERGFRRVDVAALLRAGPLRTPAGDRVPAPSWDHTAKEAGVVGGLEQWRERLAHAANARRRVLAWQGAAPEEELEDRRLATVRALADFVEHLGGLLSPPEVATWSGWSAWAARALDVLLEPIVAEREPDALAAVRAALHDLAALDGVDRPPDLPRLRRALAVELDRPGAAHGRFGHGVLVGRVADAVGADLDLVVVLGAADGRFPPGRADDPLVPERDRAAAGGALPPRALTRAEEHRDVLAALASAERSVLVAPRADPREQRERQPAAWFLDACTARAGRLVSSTELRALAAQPWFDDLPSFEAGISGGAVPASRLELDLGDLLAEHRSGRAASSGVVAGDDPHLRRGLAAAEARRDGRFDEWSGRVGEHPDLLAGLDRPRSPTGLERYALCPFRFYLADVLRIGEVEEPADIDLLTPMDEGSLVHEVLERFIGERLHRGPDEPWTDEDRAALLAIAEEVAGRYRDEGRTGRPLLWGVRWAQLRHQLLRTLDRDEQLRAADAVAPAAVELRFGDDDDEGVAIELAGGGHVRFKGIIDRVDVSADGRRLVVYDYKTGKPEPFRSVQYEGGAAGDLTARGTKLQLPIYALAARRRFPGAEEVHARYWFVGRAGEGRTLGGPFDEAAEARFRDVVGTIVDGIGHGRFPANPGDESYRGGAWSHANCTWCPYDRICPSSRGETWVEVRRTPELAAYVALAEEQPGADEGEVGA